MNIVCWDEKIKCVSILSPLILTVCCLGSSKKSKTNFQLTSFGRFLTKDLWTRFHYCLYKCTFSVSFRFKATEWIKLRWSQQTWPRFWRFFLSLPATKLLNPIEEAASEIVLKNNAAKTEFISYNHEGEIGKQQPH